jgi:hypothetical protein
MKLDLTQETAREIVDNHLRDAIANRARFSQIELDGLVWELMPREVALWRVIVVALGIAEDAVAAPSRPERRRSEAQPQEER